MLCLFLCLIRNIEKWSSSVDDVRDYISHHNLHFADIHCDHGDYANDGDVSCAMIREIPIDFDDAS